MTKPLHIVARVHAMPPEHNAGAEHMLVTMLAALVKRGHQAQVWLSRAGSVRDVYDYEGIEVVPQGSRLDFGVAARRADLLVSHLECVPTTAALARGFGRPMAVICHNDHRPTLRDMAAGGVTLAVYNSQWVEAEAALFFAEYPSSVRPRDEIVVRPPVDADRYATKPGSAVTLINCNEDKGGLVFEALARRMPDRQFLAVTGAYGEQILPGLPNVEVVDHVPGEEMAARVYRRTRVLLMPSAYESWGRTAVEALASGIPVVAHPTRGLCESLGDAGIYIDRSDVGAWQSTLERLLGDPAEYRLAAKRARARSAELDPASDLQTWCDAVEEVAGARPAPR
ncbi:glycosyltransferase family 4 protein [Streptomyces anthocyanicus]|uniref:glycosyltransferase family 4 protein n=1 Tax=Streptomyces anthocyanicus TaxID=68174 RepID=UPI003822B07D